MSTLQSPLRILILTRHWKLSQIALSPLLRQYPELVQGFVFSVGGMGVKRIPKLKMLRQILRQSGGRYLLYQLSDFIYTAYLTVLRWLSPNHPRVQAVYDLYQVACQRNYLCLEAADINDHKVVKTIRQLQPDLVLSVYFDQLISGEIITSARYGCLNFHPSDLPKYRGVNPMFWAALYQEHTVGATFHYMNEMLDKGNIVSQRYFSTQGYCSVMRMETYGAKLAQEMIIDIVETLTAGQSLPNQAQDVAAGSYFSFPKRHQVMKLRRRGFRLFFLRDILDDQGGI